MNASLFSHLHMSISVWLKVRKREDVNPIEHLHFWLQVFSDRSKYDITIYNENLDLSNLTGYKIVNAENLLQHSECHKWHNFIYASRIADRWKRPCFALTVPYIYLNSEYVINIDGCDMKLYGDVPLYLDKCIDLMKEHDLPTMSCDNILSYNPYDNRGIMLNHWSFGVNVSKREPMKDIVFRAINLVDEFERVKGPLFRSEEVNIDVLMSFYLLEQHREYKYVAFITENKLTHQGSFFSRFNKDVRKFELELTVLSQRHPDGCHIFADLHPKTFLIQ